MRVNIRKKYREFYNRDRDWILVKTDTNPFIDIETKTYKDPKDSDYEKVISEDRGFITISYYYKGFLHRDDGPAYTSYYANGREMEELYYHNNQLHRKNSSSPVSIRYYPNGNIESERYIFPNQDIVKRYHEVHANALQSEEWFDHDANRHREDGPSLIRYDWHGNVTYMEWRERDQLIRNEYPSDT